MPNKNSLEAVKKVQPSKVETIGMTQQQHRVIYIRLQPSINYAKLKSQQNFVFYSIPISNLINMQHSKKHDVTPYN